MPKYIVNMMGVYSHARVVEAERAEQAKVIMLTKNRELFQEVEPPRFMHEYQPEYWTVTEVKEETDKTEKQLYEAQQHACYWGAVWRKSQTDEDRLKFFGFLDQVDQLEKAIYAEKSKLPNR